MSDAQRAAFWDRACDAKGHTGYEDALLHRYDQPIRLALVDRILRGLFPSGMQGRTVLDIGCGTGDFIALERRHGATVTGADISPTVIRNTAARFAADRHVSLLTGTILELPLAPGSFDTITSITVLQHVVDDAEFARSLRALRDALKPEGRMIVLELAPPHAAPMRMMDASGYVYLIERTPGIWQSAFEQAGLKVVAMPTFPQFGIAMLRVLGNFIDRARAGLAPGQVAQQEPATSAPEVSLSVARRLKRTALHAVRRTLLVLAWPFDYLLHLALPPPVFRHYRVWVLARNVP